MNGKSFCSQECLNKFKNANSIKCSLEGCERKFLKANDEATCILGRWFCCDAHAELDPEAAKYIEGLDQ